MKKNVGTIDKAVRLILVALSVVLFFTHIITGVAMMITVALAGVFLMTSLVSFCPLYVPLRIKTTK